MNYRIRHQTSYDYREAVTLSHHVLRLRPRASATQNCLKHELKIDPSPSLLYSETDYFGNSVAFLTVEGAHARFTVESESLVEVCSSSPPAPSETAAWETVRDLFIGDSPAAELSACEFAFDSPYIRRSTELTAYAAASFSAERPTLEAVLDLTRRIYTDFKFDSSATTVATPLSEVLKLRRGVCQDFAHLEIGCLRAMGVPARYVSGYLETRPPPGKAKLVGADASHAWISFYCPGHGWIDADPTNNVLPSDRHITISWGRDYGDISPVRGVLLGSGAHSLSVAVDVLPIG